MSDYRSALLSALRNLAASADEQLAYLESIDVPEGVDELALELDDLSPNAERRLEAGEYTRDQFLAVRALDEALDRMSGAENHALWTADALRNSPEWTEIRGLASRALELFSTSG